MVNLSRFDADTTSSLQFIICIRRNLLRKQYVGRLFGYVLECRWLTPIDWNRRRASIEMETLAALAWRCQKCQKYSLRGMGGGGG